MLLHSPNAWVAPFLTVMYCPSDNVIDEVLLPSNISCQPVYSAADHDEGFAAFYVDPFSDYPMAATNYAGCSGATAGGYYPFSEYAGYEGMFQNRQRVALRDILDGTSQTVMFAEILGWIENYQRKAVRPWAFGGIAKGRGPARWGSRLSDDGKTFFLGDRAYAGRGGFASSHPGVVNICRGDGSVAPISRGIDVWTWYALCGRADGKLATESE